MAKKRDLKHNINYVCAELMSECVAISLYGDKPATELEPLLESILRINSDYVKRLSHQEPGMSPRAYYDDVIRGFNEEISEIVDHLYA